MSEAEQGSPQGAATTSASITAAAEAAQSAFIRGESVRAETGATPQDTAAELGKPADGKAEAKTAADPAADAPTDEDAKEPPKLKRLERPKNAEEAFKARLKQRRDQAVGPKEAPELTAARQELERLRSEGQTSNKRTQDLESALQKRDLEAFAKLAGTSVEEMTREYISGKKEAPPKDPEVIELKKELESLRAEREREAKERQEREALERSEREFNEQLGWIREIAETHEVPSVTQIVKDDTVRDVFLRQAHTILQEDANLPMDEVFGLVLDNYRPVAKALLPVFPEIVEEWVAQNPQLVAKLLKSRPQQGGGLQGLKPDAARSSTGRERPREADANRRGSADEGAHASDTTADAESWSPELAQQWGDRKQREFLRKINGRAG